MQSYLEQLRDPRWQRKRLQVLDAAGWRCIRCAATQRTLHVHHREYRNVAVWEYELSELEALCDACHHKAHGCLRGNDRFDANTPYTRLQIKEVLDGETKGFLPMEKGRVLYGCFRRKFNPDAPEILLPGDLSRITEPAERFCRQSFPIPIFLCEEGENWSYQGDYSVESWTENPKEVAIHNQRTNRADISRVIFLKKWQ